MNILKKELAPITEKAWKEISDQADDIFTSLLSHRKVVGIDGPNGLEFGAVSTGRLSVPGNQDKEGVNYGIHQVMPLVEIRKPFSLNLWELDNLERGAEDIDLAPLEEAARQVARFENRAVYEGFKQGSIAGLANGSDNPVQKLPDDPDLFIQTIAGQISILRKAGVEGPYNLVLTDDRWQQLVTLSKGYPAMRYLKDIMEGDVLINHETDHSFLLSGRGEDFQLILGQDLSVGYDAHDAEKVKLYLMESFTFRILGPEALIVLTE